MPARIEPGSVIRIARTAAGWSQADLGQRCGYSASQISRWETGRLPLRDVILLRTLATVLDISPKVFGLASDDTDGVTSGPSRPSSPTVRMPVQEEDLVRRRMFLVAAGVAGTSLALPNPVSAVDFDPAELLAERLSDVLLGPVTAEPVSLPVLEDALGLAQREFSTCRYVPLAARLPALIAAADATAAVFPAAHLVLAKSYNLTTRALGKLEVSGLQWLSADRGLHAARATEDALTFAESQRLVATVARRSGQHDRALALTLDAANSLDVTNSAHLAMYGMLLCSAGYAAASGGDRDRANDLLTEAETAAARVPQDRGLAANIISYRVSAAYALGDAGRALTYAQSLPVAAIPTMERRARLLVDVAMSYAQWGKPDLSYATLLAAERSAPHEVHTRNAVRRLVADLMRVPRQMSGLPALARRVHVM